jgi:hypothetical protein
MIALLLAAQLSGAIVDEPPSKAAAAAIASGRATVVSPLSDRPLQVIVKGGCATHNGRVEVSLGEPTALYRQGDRPAKGLRDWVSYPAPHYCLIGGAP